MKTFIVLSLCLVNALAFDYSGCGVTKNCLGSPYDEDAGTTCLDTMVIKTGSLSRIKYYTRVQLIFLEFIPIKYTSFSIRYYTYMMGNLD